MRKNVLTRSLLVCAAGLGFATASHAVSFFGTDASLKPDVATGGAASQVQATDMVLNPAGVGHVLFVPYFTAQGANETLLSITNTDTQNAKAVKVRFRGGANSDDVMDFTVLMSPGDVWTTTVVKDASGVSRLVASGDTTCTVPKGVGSTSDVSLFSDADLPVYLSDADKKNHTREGYVEIINMADIVPASGLQGGTSNSVYAKIKHTKGALASNGCDDALQNLMVATFANNAASNVSSQGFRHPTGGLIAEWALVQASNFAVYSGKATAFEARGADAKDDIVRGYGNMVLAPQVDIPVTGRALGAKFGGVDLTKLTADPVILSYDDTGTGAYYGKQPKAFDFPDMSTPYVGGNFTAAAAAADNSAYKYVSETLSPKMAVKNIINSFTNLTPSNGVSFVTDWVVSQPTRRYFTAVSYGNLNPDAQNATNQTSFARILFAGNSDDATVANWSNQHAGAAGGVVIASNVGAQTANPYATIGMVYKGSTPFTCLSAAGGNGAKQFWNREETSTTAQASSAVTSPRPTVIPGSLCGETAVYTFGTAEHVVDGYTTKSHLNSNLTTIDLSGENRDGFTTGWARIAFTNAIPMVGFAATTINNGTGNYAMTIPHSWE